MLHPALPPMTRPQPPLSALHFFAVEGEAEKKLRRELGFGHVEDGDHRSFDGNETDDLPGFAPTNQSIRTPTAPKEISVSGSQAYQNKASPSDRSIMRNGVTATVAMTRMTSGVSEEAVRLLNTTQPIPILAEADERQTPRSPSSSSGRADTNANDGTKIDPSSVPTISPATASSSKPAASAASVAEVSTLQYTEMNVIVKEQEQEPLTEKVEDADSPIPELDSGSSVHFSDDDDDNDEDDDDEDEDMDLGP